jgi:glycosyltransferase involved in cell wall biosynthesis
MADPRPAYAAMDLLAMTSVQPEPFGGVISEAMSVGLPVVATNHGGALDQVVDGVTGFLVPPGDPVALADAIERLLRDPELRRRMGVAARARAEQEFSLARMGQRIGELLVAAIEGRAPDPSLVGSALPDEARSAAPPRRVLHVHSSADTYGSGRSLLRLVQGMDRRRFQSLVVLPEDGRLRQLIEAQGVEVIVHPRLSVITRQAFYSWRFLSPFLNYPFSVWYLGRLMRRRRIDLVHTNTGVILASALAARLARVPHVWHVREWFQEFPRLWFAYSGYIQSLSRAVVAVSSAIAAQFPRSDKVIIIHNGFSLEEFQVPKENFRAEVRKRYGLNGAFVVGCVGRIKLVRKGQEVLVEATALLKQRGQPIRALIVGAPFPGNESHLARLRQMVVQRGVEDLVVFAGELNDPRPAYAAMDVLAMTSVQPEPFAGAVMEAMSMGLPVIATQVGGSLDQVVEGVTGLLVPPGDPAALADAIGKLMQDPAGCQRMSRAAVDRVRDHFSLTEMTRNIESLFEQTMDSTCRAPARR